MKYILSAALLAAASFNTASADVGVSVTIAQPGMYGRIDIGGFPHPPVIFPDPIAIERVPVGAPIIYLHVPPGHARHWRQHCHEYNACGARVMFVQGGWYDREYVPRYRERHGMGRDDRRESRDQYREDNGRGRRGRDEGRRGDRGYRGDRGDRGRD